MFCSGMEISETSCSRFNLPLATKHFNDGLSLNKSYRVLYFGVSNSLIIIEKLYAVCIVQTEFRRSATLVTTLHFTVLEC